MQDTWRTCDCRYQYTKIEAMFVNHILTALSKITSFQGHINDNQIIHTVQDRHQWKDISLSQRHFSSYLYQVDRIFTSSYRASLLMDRAIGMQKEIAPSQVNANNELYLLNS